MKKIMLLFCACCLGASAAYSQDDTYYTPDNNIVDKNQTAPPPLPTYEQPPCPYEGYMWTPGYWAWGLAGYYWVPGVWVRPPHLGYLWTPGYWGFFGGYYGWHRGYWGEHIGYYGGVCYGFGYGGIGFYGGRWAGGVFQYNTAVWHVNAAVIHNTYISNEHINATATVNHASFNGQGGVIAQPTAGEKTAMSESHVQATSEQLAHQQTASTNKAQLASNNHGLPPTTAMNAANGQHFSSTGQASGRALPATAPHSSAAAQPASKSAVPAAGQSKGIQAAGASPQAKPAASSTTAPKAMQAKPRSAPRRMSGNGGGGRRGK